MISWIRSRFHPLWRLRQMVWFREVQNRFDFTVAVRRGSIRQHVLLLRDFSHIIPHRGAEERTSFFFSRILEFWKPQTFLDVGANVGDYSWKVKDYAPSTETWMFEPDEKNVTLLKMTVQKNRLDRIHLVPKAVSSQNGQAEFLIDQASGTTGSLENHSSNQHSLHAAYRMARTRTVECCALDSFYEQITGNRLLIKIDVEGAEDKVFAGAQSILQKIRPIIFVECLDPKKLTALSVLQYQAFDLKEGSNWIAIPMELVNEFTQKLPEIKILSFV